MSTRLFRGILDEVFFYYARREDNATLVNDGIEARFEAGKKNPLHASVLINYFSTN